MKQAGILTFHQSCNYGAVLQAYALMRVVGALGFDAHIIDYAYTESARMPLGMFLKKKPSAKQLAYYLAKPLLPDRAAKVREENFKKFRKKYLNESARVATAGEIEALHYDVYISGSDQIWNYHITDNAFDGAFFLQFGGAKKLVYAASAQNPPFEPQKERELAALLERMDFPVTVREKQLADYVEKLTGRRVPQVIDPTLLAGRQAFDTIELPQLDLPPYVLQYQIDANPRTDISVAALEKRFGCAAYSFSMPKNKADTQRRGDLGPDGFLAMLQGAEAIVTNSFHGVALSLLFHKQFFVYENGGVMSRIDSLLDSVSLADRKIKMTADIEPSQMIDYRRVDARLEELRSHSEDILKQAIL